IITPSSIDFPLGSASRSQLYSGSNPTCPLDPSPLKPAATRLNPSHSPVVSFKAPFWAHSFSSCIGPTTPLSHIIKSSSVDHHLYADDTQLFISFSPASFSTSIAQLLSVVNQISQWMSSNLLRLNPSKTEFIIIVYLPKSRKFLTLQYTSPITHLPLLSPLMPLSVILVLLSILISLSPTTSPTSPAPASCTSVTSAAYDPCLTLKLPPPLPPPYMASGRMRKSAQQG